MGWFTSSPTTETIALLEDQLRDVRPCESIHHKSHEYHRGFASFLQIGVCEHTTGYRCEPFVKYLRGEYPSAPRIKNIKCPICKVSVPVGELRFVPLEGWL